MTFQETVLAARDSEVPITFDQQTLNPHFAFQEDDGSTHHVWFLDAVTAFNQIRAADVFRPAGYALWRLGSEDPSIWSVLGRPYDAAAPEDLKVIVPGSDIDFEGEGEILKIAAEPADGSRAFEMDPNHSTITSETFTKIPSSYVIRRSGAVPGKVALTFDDGPSDEWTPKILDILKAKGVKATFFLIGENGETNPSLVKRIYAEGHEIGNHTFTHPNLGLTSDEVTQVEINATQRLVEALTGRSMRLFRAPFFGDAEPTTPNEILPISQAQKLGYVSVGLEVDPDDWQHPPAETHRAAGPGPDGRHGPRELAARSYCSMMREAIERRLLPRFPCSSTRCARRGSRSCRYLSSRVGAATRSCRPSRPRICRRWSIAWCF